MMFRRCCPPCSRQPRPNTCRMTGQGDGHTAQPYAMQQTPQGGQRMAQPCHRQNDGQGRGMQCARVQLIESIAREENGIAGLLAAEAQRLMRGARCANSHEWMAIGQSVRQTLEAIIDLEHVLLEKLELTLGECMLNG